jgi:serine/threonine protein kinase
MVAHHGWPVEAPCATTLTADLTGGGNEGIDDGTVPVTGLQPGDALAGYRIVGVLGRGGMGAVYRAEDIRLGRHVALKVLGPEMASDARFRERFERESRLLASIEHPNIVDVFHAGHVDGISFLVMRLIDGFDLGALLADSNRLEPPAAAHIVSAVAAALDKAHAHGLVHRDVKPGNILISPGEGPLEQARVLLSDFGLTKRVSEASPLTSTGQFMGTVQYVAPEQIQGSRLDGRADLYSLACVAFECLAGHPPFGAAREAAALMAHLVSPPPDLSITRPDLPPAAGQVLISGMAKDRDDRPARCADFASALRAALGVDTVAAAGTAAAAPMPLPGASPTAAPTLSSAGGTKWPAEWKASAPDHSPTIVASTPIVATPAFASEGYGPWTDVDPAPAPRRAHRGRRRDEPRSFLATVTGALLVIGVVAAAVAIGSTLFPSIGLPGLGGGATPSAAATADAAAERLLSHIPAALRPACVAETAVAPALAARRCTLEDGNLVVLYWLYPDAEAMNRAYVQSRSSLGLPAGARGVGGRCADQATWPSEGPFTVSGDPTGRLLCTIGTDSSARMDWTDERADVLTSAVDRRGDGRRLYRFWKDGRLPAATVARSPAAPQGTGPPPPAPATQAPATQAPATQAPATEPPIDPPATELPTAEPSAATGPDAQLLSHIPADLHSSCVAEGAILPVLAAQRCTLSDGAVVATYRLFPDGLTMNLAYEVVRLGLGIETDAGEPGASCADPAAWPRERPYTIAGTPAGRLVCTGGGPGVPARMDWTDERLNILSSVTRADGDRERAERFWRNRAGPDE